MGPSGAGKSTFLDAICQRTSRASGEVTINGTTDYSVKALLSFVEQDDALLGVLTVRETVTFAAQLALGPSFPNLSQHVDATLASLGLSSVAHQRIGTPLQRGVSGGQKRRLTIACSVVAKPRILVLDEPTSGLDAKSGKEVVAFLQRLAHEQGVLVICTIHQPAYETFALFDRLLLLARGKVMFDGPTTDLDRYLVDIGSPTPEHVNPVDQVVDVVSTDFLPAPAHSNAISEKAASSPTTSHLAPDHMFPTADERVDGLAATWAAWAARNDLVRSPLPSRAGDENLHARSHGRAAALVGLRKTLALSHRNVLNYSRSLLAYGIRLGMYIGMAFLLATIWVHLGWSASKLNDRLSVSFFSVAFLGFMSVAGIPAFLEERAVFIRERANGLYSPGQYLLASTLVSVPFLFACTLVYSLIIYWAIPMNSGATHFFRFLLYLFLAIFAAESQSLLLASAVPIFVAALALASFANGLWMVNMGYFIKSTSLPRFWYYTFHFMDYQTFSFDLLVRNDFSGRVLPCGVDAAGACLCPIESSLLATTGECAISGHDVLQDLDIAGVSDGLYVGILVIIIIVFRLLMWGMLVWRKR
ncbi:uncharacterized protein RHOBADRAFT_37583 [Rhodotorula graminis WP1]|uniref:ABC transporter domain-containing protein n=1 Tax=Rhodotorula graminis (strain WP1) TaxID=578459 RepID=A0A194S1Y6_RHOGW|nr:uncharacterized protein RHOBADRAFT_37583 [Rhodotorula graminis WP1]KPV74540.1 hypothetical protein RHOBADRAFT_37583 [Rhodotorula graminis WP1]